MEYPELEGTCKDHWVLLPETASVLWIGILLWGMPPPCKYSRPDGWDCEQPGLEGGVPSYSRGLDLDDLKDPFQPKPFYDSMVLLRNGIIYFSSSVRVCWNGRRHKVNCSWNDTAVGWALGFVPCAMNTCSAMGHAEAGAADLHPVLPGVGLCQHWEIGVKKTWPQPSFPVQYWLLVYVAVFSELVSLWSCSQ